VTKGIHGSAADRGTFRDVRGRSPTIRLTLASAGSSHHAYNYTYLSQIPYHTPLEINSLVSENQQLSIRNSTGFSLCLIKLPAYFKYSRPTFDLAYYSFLNSCFFNENSTDLFIIHKQPFGRAFAAKATHLPCSQKSTKWLHAPPGGPSNRGLMFKRPANWCQVGGSGTAKR
jgi:hypothetical protein